MKTCAILLLLPFISGAVCAESAAVEVAAAPPPAGAAEPEPAAPQAAAAAAVAVAAEAAEPARGPSPAARLGRNSRTASPSFVEAAAA